MSRKQKSADSQPALSAENNGSLDGGTESDDQRCENQGLKGETGIAETNDRELLTSGVAEVHVDGTRQDLHDLARTSSGGRTMDTALSSASPDGSAIFLEEKTSTTNDGQNCYRRREESGHGEQQIDDRKNRIGDDRTTESFHRGCT